MWRCPRIRSSHQWPCHRPLFPLRSITGQPGARSNDGAPHEAPESKSSPLPDHEAGEPISESSQAQHDSPAIARKHRLPLSPLMDPPLLAARNRHRHPKPAASPASERSPFSQKLRNNPYALALATPIRNCTLTGLRLPQFFHLDFGLQPNPATGELWYLPRMAAEASSKPRSKAASEQDSSDITNTADEQQRSTSPSPKSPQKEASHTSPPQNAFPLRTLSSTHLPSRHSALAFISSLPKRQQRQIIPFRWKDDPSLASSLATLHYRRDMAEYVLSLLRQRVYDRLKELGGRVAGYIARCDSWDTVEKHQQAAAVLWLGEGRRVYSGADLRKGIEEGNGDGEGMEGLSEWGGNKKRGDEGPPVYAMARYRGRYIPAYNLPFLLGNEIADKLGREVLNMKGEMAVLKGKHCTVECQMALWRLMGYLAPWEGG